MTQFLENTQKDDKKEGEIDPISESLCSYNRGSNKYNYSRVAFKSQRYRVQS